MALCLRSLPVELVASLAQAIEDLLDRAALCIALPMITAAVASASDARATPQFAIALLIWARRGAHDDMASLVVTERLLRRYMAERAASSEECEWLKQTSRREALLRSRRACVWVVRMEEESGAATRWHLCSSTSTLGALLRRDVSGFAQHYVGGLGSERQIRWETPGGLVACFEGERKSERLVRMDLPNGTATYYGGECGFERMLRIVYRDGSVAYYRGERGVEKIVSFEA